MVKASKATGIAPNKMKLLSFNDKPWVIKSPNPPAPINAAIVVMPIIIAMDVLIPAMIMGSARGTQ